MPKTIQTTQLHEAFRTDLIELLRKHAGALPAEDMLALAAHMVGQMIALQERRRFTPDSIMDLVIANIKLGNQHAIDKMVTHAPGHG